MEKVAFTWTWLDGMQAPSKGEGRDTRKVDAKLFAQYERAEKRWLKLLKEVEQQAE
jgi:hypothetical protein